MCRKIKPAIIAVICHKLHIARTGEISAITAGLSADASVVTVQKNGSTWTISQNGAYLNHFGGSNSTRAAGWKDGSAANDALIKATGQSDGIRSYGRVVDLMLAYYSAENE